MKNQEINAIVKWQFWLYNHGEPKQILKECFPDLWQHFYSKFCAFAERRRNTVMAWSELFMELSTERQRILAEWVIDHYDGIDSRLEKDEGIDVYRVIAKIWYTEVDMDMCPYEDEKMVHSDIYPTEDAANAKFDELCKKYKDYDFGCYMHHAVIDGTGCHNEERIKTFKN